MVLRIALRRAGQALAVVVGLEDARNGEIGERHTVVRIAGAAAATADGHRSHRAGHGAGRSYGDRQAGRLVHVGHYTTQLLERVGLHHDVVLGQQQRGDLGQFAHRRRVRVRDDAPQLVQRVVQVVHAAPLAGVDAQTHRFALAVFP